MQSRDFLDWVDDKLLTLNQMLRGCYFTAVWGNMCVCVCVSPGILSPFEDGKDRCGFFRQEMQREDDDGSDGSLVSIEHQVQVFILISTHTHTFRRIE